MKKPVIELRHVYKEFIYASDRTNDVKTFLVKLCTGKLSRAKVRKKIVLDDVNLEIMPGETVGIMGRNGTGKSTLMRILSGIYQPDKGQVIVRERLAALVALNAGFHADLSGYENIFLNAAILGIPRSEVRELVPRIVEFSELGDEIFNPVKNYSSGMVLRLGFAVASHVDAPILIFDEVLSVGDEGFQKKCFAKITELFKSGRTVILVTHDPGQVKKYCQRCVVFEQGKIVFDGPSAEGAEVYSALFT